MKNKIFQISIVLLFFLVALLVPFKNVLINYILYFVSYIIVGYEVIIEAFEHIFKGKVFDENCLMLIATIGAFAIGEFPEAVVVMLLYQIGETFQNYAVDKSKKSITELMNIRPDFANVKRDGDIIRLNPNEVKVGELIVIRPGEKIPLDGKIVEGSSFLDTSSLTGESVPQEVVVGDNVLSGCINQTSLLTIEVVKEFGESTASKILDLVENASNKKSKSENFITKFARYYTPFVVLFAFVLAVVPCFVFNYGSFHTWLYRALTFLVVSCPCALVISIPLSFFAGIGGLSRIGILVKGGNYLEALANVETVVFDKTGTLTEGVFEVQKIHAIDISEDELLKFATYSEFYSNHPIALSLKRAYAQKIDSSLISDVNELAGLGISAVVDGKNVLVGNENLMISNNVVYTKCEEIGTVIYVAVESKYVGCIVISDRIKKDALKVVESLKSYKVKKVIMLTGDRKDVAEDVAREMAIDEVYSELLPTDKARKLEDFINLNSSNGKVVFVGDGMNDSPVLALADVGVAMGGLGSDAAIEAADVVLMTDEPSKLVYAIRSSKKTLKIVKENIAFALFIKFVVLFLSAFGLATMWAAVFADVGVCVISILNALRAL